MCKKIDIEGLQVEALDKVLVVVLLTVDTQIQLVLLADDYIATFKNFPVIYLFIESLEGTLEDLSFKMFNLDLLKSCLFQITFALIYLQKNITILLTMILHINNIMYQSTDRPYLYYKYNNQYYKVPTYGKLFKIIDFGRSIFTFLQKNLYASTSFQSMVKAESDVYSPTPGIF